MKILITGASSGIGEEIAKQALKMGHHVIALARDFSKCKIQSELFKTYSIDLSDIKSLPENLTKILKKEGDIDALVLNAGKGLFGYIEQLAYEDISELINLNFVSATYVVKTFLPQMKKRKSGTLIFIGSEAALSGKTNGSIYCASKFAIRGFSQSLRKECLKSGVRVSLINPGMVDTPFFKSLHFEPAPLPENYCHPEEVAHLVLEQIQARDALVYEEINLSPLKPQISVKK